MISGYPFLTTLILLPLIGSLFIFFFVRGDSESAVENMTNMAFWTTVTNLLISIVLLVKFDPANPLFQFKETYIWIDSFNIGYRVGIDGLSLTLILLTTALMPICICCSKEAIKHKTKEYLILFLLLESLIIGTFASLDIIAFYLFFEILLIPMFLIIGTWGGRDRIYAAFKFFLYTFFGSILFLLAVITIVATTKTSNISSLYVLVPEAFSFEAQKYLWLAFFVAFAVKIPMTPFHTWLPNAHVQAPTAGSVILAAILLKMGAYGFLRFSLPLLPEASLYFQDFVYILSIFAIIYTSIVAFYQTDIKKLIAYSSIAHMGFVTLGIFSFNEQGIAGAIFQMISHGIISGALFLSVGMIYSRFNTRDIAGIKAIAVSMPKFAIFFVIFTLGSVALPGTSGFVGEFLVLLSSFKVSPFYMILASLGVIFGAVYMLWLVKAIIMGNIQENRDITDVNQKEFMTLLLLSISVIIFGIFPNLIINLIEVQIESLLDNFYLILDNNLIFDNH